MRARGPPVAFQSCGLTSPANLDMVSIQCVYSGPENQYELLLGPDRNGAVLLKTQAEGLMRNSSDVQ